MLHVFHRPEAKLGLVYVEKYSISQYFEIYLTSESVVKYLTLSAVIALRIYVAKSRYCISTTVERVPLESCRPILTTMPC